MALPKRFFAPSFHHRRLGIFLSSLVGIMVFMAAFIMAAEATLSGATLAWNQNLNDRLTVEIPAVDDEASVSQSERVKQALAILRAMPNVEKATAVSDDDAARLLQPWIDDVELVKALPVPSLIDVERRAGQSLTADDVKQQLKTVLRDARVDDHAAWLADLVHFVRGLAAFGGLMIVLATVTLVLAVSLVCRAVMATERETISLLHIMGADDADIARHFESHVRHLSLSAAGIGSLLALLAAGSLLYALRHFANLASLHPSHWWMLIGMVAAVPAAAIWIASLSARQSVLGFLRSLP